MKRARRVLLFSLVLAGILGGPTANAQIPPPANPEEVLSDAYTGKSYSPYAGRAFASRPLWGDTHLHTGNSFDAGAFGARLLPEDAFRFGIPIPEGAPVSTQERAYTSPIWYTP